MDLVGREQELTGLEEALGALEAGESAFLTVEGEPGIGKTRLLDELRARAEKRGHVVLHGAAAEFEREMPFGVWVDALDAYVASQELAESEEWPPELIAELVPVLPSLGNAAGDGAIADERYRTHRAVRSLVGHMAEDKPLVLVLDDLHWSDGASLELLSALVHRDIGAPVMLAMGFRPAQAAGRLSAAVAGNGVERLRLEALSEEESVRLLGEQVDAQSAAAIYRQGGGNPFYLEQLGRSGGSELPSGLADSIAEELESLPEASRSLLSGAAVAGEPFEPDLAAAVSGLEQAAGLDALDDLLARDLVRPTNVPRRFIFRHPLVRQTVYESAGGGWKLAAHGRAAEALAARGAGASERAHHVEQSAGQGDEEAIALLVDAGEGAAARAPATAARWFEAALRLLPAVDTERQVDVRVKLASAQRAVGELDSCRSTLLEALELLPDPSGPRAVELTTLCAAVEHWQGRHEDAHRRLERAWEELPDRDTHEAIELQIELAVDGLYTMDLQRTIEMGEKALAGARAQGDDGLIAAAASALALGAGANGDIESARRHREEALEYIERLDNAQLAERLETLYYVSWAENYLELYEEAIAHAERGIEIVRSHGQGRLLVPLMLVRGYTFEMLGRLPEAIEMCETAVEISRVSANLHYLFWSLYELGFAHYFAGHIDAAIEAGEESMRIGDRLTGGTMPSAGGGPGWVLAVARFEAGKTESGLAELLGIGGEDQSHAIPVERCFNWENLAVAALALDKADVADGFAARAEQDAANLKPLHLPNGLALRTRAAVLFAQGNAEKAGETALESLREFEAAGSHLNVAFARILRGQALAAAGDRAEAIEVLREAERELDAYGSVRVRDEARRELRKLGARAEPRGPATAEDSGIGSLTKRELEIAELITRRMTNGEIAGELFLSKKTVESHIRNLFMKLGASSRVEVARIVERERA